MLTQKYFAPHALVSALPSSRVVAVLARSAVVHPLVIQSLATRVLRSESVGVLLGDNHFDLYALMRLLQAHTRQRAPLLDRVEISRAFTCYQLHQRLLTLDPARKKWRALYVLGLLDTFYDESVAAPEATQLLHACLRTSRSLAAKNLSVLMTISAPPQPGREKFIAQVAQMADVYLELQAPPGPAGPRQRKMFD